MPASTPDAAPRKLSFLAFWLQWAALRGWEVPRLHVLICHWLEVTDAPERLLMVFRGAAKSTLFAGYKAWRLYRDATGVHQVWSADDKTAGKLTRDALNILRRHPACRGLVPGKPGATAFWVAGATDIRNPSLEAISVNSNATGSRCTAADFDDVEVPKNIRTPEGRLAIRTKIDEATHILVPGGQKTYIGTPHTTDSIYQEAEAGGAATLKIPLFARSVRYEKTAELREYDVPWELEADGLWVFAGISYRARLLVEGIDYQRTGNRITFARAPGVPIDLLTGNAWPERFTRADVLQRRRGCRTYGAWDSQYQLKATPLQDVRLDPKRLVAYAVEPRLRWANGQASMWLGNARIIGLACRWDPSGAKLRSDVSALALVLQDEHGRRYWHVAKSLQGEVAIFDATGMRIVGGQVAQIVEIVRKYSVPRVTVETNGVGAFAPVWLRAALKQAKLEVGVVEVTAIENKNRRILEAIQAPLSSGMLWANVEVLRGPSFAQMRDWNPAVPHQPDDYIDAFAGAITETPERFRHVAGLNEPGRRLDSWRGDTPEGFVVQVDY